VSETLIPEEIVGWRAWGVKLWQLHGPALYSLYQVTRWPTDAWLYAECARRLDGSAAHKGGPPHDGCSCGIYAARDREHLDEQGYAEDSMYLRVIGEVGLAGRVVVCSRGYRAARARVRRLFVPYERWEFVAPLREAYNVPVELDYIIGPQEVLR
jgi:hypothetical protein